MSEREFEVYLKLLSQCLALTAGQREQIADELRDHLEERLSELDRAGISRDQAVLKALEEFGDAAVLAAHFATVAHLRKRKLLMRLSLGSVAVLTTAVLLALAFLPENRIVQGPARIIAQDKPKPADVKKTPADQIPVGKLPQKIPVERALSSDEFRFSNIETALESRVDFGIPQQPFRDALDLIRSRCQIPIVIDQKGFKEVGFDLQTEVSINAPGLKLRTFLKLLLEQFPQGIAFEVRDEVLMIETVDAIKSHMAVIVYDCRDLAGMSSDDNDRAVRLRTPEAAQANPLGFPEGIVWAPASGSSETGKQAANKAVVSGGPGVTIAAPAKNKTPIKRPRPRSMTPLIHVIQEATGDDRKEWDDSSSASITDFGGLLVVRQNAQVHEQIKNLLADIRRMKKEGAYAPGDAGK